MARVTPDKAEVLQQVGRAVAVLVEGRSVGGDAWIYSDRWFKDRSREIRFLGADDAKEVRTRVAALRAEPPDHPIFGVIDRDCASDDELDSEIADGIFRSRRYSVENYLLDPSGWLAAFQMMSRGGFPQGWGSEAEVAGQIEATYRECSLAAAFNRTISQAKRAHPDWPLAPQYLQVPHLTRRQQLEASLHAWQGLYATEFDLQACFDAEFAALQQATLDNFHRLIDGKLVLTTLVHRFQVESGRRSMRPDDWINVYLGTRPDPPQDAIDLVDRILRAAGRL